MSILSLGHGNPAPTFLSSPVPPNDRCKSTPSSLQDQKVICNYCIALCVNVAKMTEATDTCKFCVCNKGCTALASDPLKNGLCNGTYQSMPGETSESGMIL